MPLQTASVRPPLAVALQREWLPALAASASTLLPEVAYWLAGLSSLVKR
jgi:hypothetical protein